MATERWLMPLPERIPKVQQMANSFTRSKDYNWCEIDSAK